jgi:hypothetical protein
MSNRSCFHPVRNQARISKTLSLTDLVQFQHLYCPSSQPALAEASLGDCCSVEAEGAAFVSTFFETQIGMRPAVQQEECLVDLSHHEVIWESSSNPGPCLAWLWESTQVRFEA